MNISGGRTARQINEARPCGKCSAGIAETLNQETREIALENTGARMTQKNLLLFVLMQLSLELVLQHVFHQRLHALRQ